MRRFFALALGIVTVVLFLQGAGTNNGGVQLAAAVCGASAAMLALPKGKKS